MAIRAMGRAQEPRLAASAKNWLDDPEPLVRAAAIVLLADYPDQITDGTVKKLSKDDDPKVRIGLAHAIGFGQISDHVNALGVMINDSDPQVAAAAALSLVSCSLDVARMTLEANVDHPEFRSVFVNALASKDATHYVDQLADIVRNDLRPKHWWGGHIPWGVSWGILFKHLQKQPAVQLRSGKFDDALDALESPTYYSSSEPRDLYALRSNVRDWTPEELWEAYVQLAEAELAFRIQKSDLRIRPIWHQKEERVLAHILVCFLAYVLWKTLAQMCQRARLGNEPRRVIDEVGEKAPSMVLVMSRKIGAGWDRLRCAG